MPKKQIILFIFFLSIFMGYTAHAAVYTVAIEDIKVVWVGDGGCTLSITFTTTALISDIDHAEIWAQEDEWWADDWKKLKTITDVAYETTTTVFLKKTATVDSYKDIHVKIILTNGEVIRSEGYKLGMGVNTIATITYPDGSEFTYNYRGELVHVQESDIIHRVLAFILDIPYRIYQFFTGIATAAIEFLSSLIENAVSSISGSFGIAQPLAATAVGMGIFLGVYFIIKIVLYIV